MKYRLLGPRSWLFYPWIQLRWGSNPSWTGRCWSPLDARSTCESSYRNTITNSMYVLCASKQVCTYVCICTYTHTHIYTFAHDIVCICASVHLYIYASVHLYINASVHTHNCTFVYTCICTFIHTSICTFVNTWICTFAHTCICTFVHTSIHTVVAYINAYHHQLQTYLLHLKIYLLQLTCKPIAWLFGFLAYTIAIGLLQQIMIPD